MYETKNYTEYKNNDCQIFLDTYSISIQYEKRHKMYEIMVMACKMYKEL